MYNFTIKFSKASVTLLIGILVYKVKKSKQLILLAFKFLMFEVNLVVIYAPDIIHSWPPIGDVILFMRMIFNFLQTQNYTSKDNCFIWQQEAPAINLD